MKHIPKNIIKDIIEYSYLLCWALIAFFLSYFLESQYEWIIGWSCASIGILTRDDCYKWIERYIIECFPTEWSIDNLNLMILKLDWKTFWTYVSGIGVGLIALLQIYGRLKNPDVTETRIFLMYWKELLVLLIITLGGLYNGK